jgi:hypothetical protein
MRPVNQQEKLQLYAGMHNLVFSRGNRNDQTVFVAV